MVLEGAKCLRVKYRAAETRNKAISIIIRVGLLVSKAVSVVIMKKKVSSRTEPMNERR